MGPAHDRKPPDLHIPLELVGQPDGSASGTLDGAAIALTATGRLEVPFDGHWPGEVVSLPKPVVDEEELGASNLYNESQRRAWMAAVFATPAVQAAVKALERAPMRIGVKEGVLLAYIVGEPTGPEVRHAARALVQLARLLPTAMTTVVDREVRADAAARRRPGYRSALQSQELWPALLTSVALAVATTVVLPLAGLWYAFERGEGWPLWGALGISLTAGLFHLLIRCPGCGFGLFEGRFRPLALLWPPAWRRFRCRHCGLQPR